MEDAAFGSDKEGRLQAVSTATQSTTAFRTALLLPQGGLVTASGRNLFHDSSAWNSIISQYTHFAEKEIKSPQAGIPPSSSSVL